MDNYSFEGMSLAFKYLFDIVSVPDLFRTKASNVLRDSSGVCRRHLFEETGDRVQPPALRREVGHSGS